MGAEPPFPPQESAHKLGQALRHGGSAKRTYSNRRHVVKPMLSIHRRTTTNPIAQPTCKTTFPSTRLDFMRSLIVSVWAWVIPGTVHRRETKEG